MTAPDSAAVRSEGGAPLGIVAGNGSSQADLAAIARSAGLEFVANLSGRTPSALFVQKIPIAFARQQQVMGLAGEAGNILLALGDARNWRILDTVGRILKTPITPVLAPAEQVRAAIHVAYEQRTGETQSLLANLSAGDVLQELREGLHEDLLDSADRSPVIRLVNAILFEAAMSHCSDVHVQPYEDRVLVRVRVDGILHDAHTLPKHLQEEVLSRIKVIGQMNIAEKRLPQDGRATVEIGDRLIDLRIASMPTSYGERAVIRLLDKSARLYTLGELGMAPQVLERLRKLIHLEHGMLLVTGPTGSGKSTTLYSALREINTQDRNVITLEDPIEYQLEGISQTQVNPKKGMTFAAGLRSVLRQDPDIIMVGEIRDQETAVMAIQSALTGHLVFSTLHTNDSASAVTRLLDLGIEPYLVASSLHGVLAQRLVRRNCVQCAVPAEPSPEELLQVGLSQPPGGSPHRGSSCEHCRHTGYRGRFALSELLLINEAIRDRIQQRANASEILQAALHTGTRLMRDDGIEKVRQGLTTLAEVARVTVSQVLE